MSTKVQTFANIITQPLNTHNFHVSIPEINYDVLVESTTFPSRKLQSVTLWFQGEPIKYPTLPGETQEWTVTLPESENGVVRKDFESLLAKTYDQKSGLLHTKKWKNIVVTARDLEDNVVFSSILHGAWIAGRSDVNLSSQAVTEPWKWQYSFIYQWIEDIDI